MWLTKLFNKPRQILGLEDLAEKLSLADGFRYDILLNDCSISLRAGEEIVAFIEVDLGQATVFYNFNTAPYLAGEIALVVRDLIPTTVSGCQFNARRLETVGVH